MGLLQLQNLFDPLGPCHLGILQGPEPVRGLEADDTDPFFHPSTYIPLLYKEAFTHGPAVLLWAT